ncbi:DUF4215 domain-containing protein [Nannocystis sp. SCPEA4]|uniref:DUF4215 domain-containing protein n=1 Tax=Nannocystis sp. SCPEA4 TaxID=2996787 RepID=UPI002270E8F9|nr:DUF4215 domain-containing protein [Nannocystis sp. SCPEA4]MCY1055682.1 DUF4215 domain-containing protein [Nannocystis sp. SCPEA4]
MTFAARRCLLLPLLVLACASGEDPSVSGFGPGTAPPATMASAPSDSTGAPTTSGTSEGTSEGSDTDASGTEPATTTSTQMTEGTGSMCLPGTLFCPCDVGDTCNAGMSCIDGQCLPHNCGNGIVEATEECDDGNDVLTDACIPGCKAAKCGDGALQNGVEECDLGPANLDTGACKTDCKLAVCGDGFIGPGETCDDANMVDNDACTNACAPAGCGDAIVQPGEECDDGNGDSSDACLATCKTAKCGDGVLWAGAEECDDANGGDNDACLNNCKTAKCGDGVLWAGVEECDDANANDNDGCNNSCKKVAQLVGSYDVQSGPPWGQNPPTYTCKEACALLFGGVAGQYTCSITGAAPTGQAYMSGYADAQFCFAPNSDNFKLNSFYNCGGFGCSYSAYVADNCNTGASINYCWKL